MSYGRRFYRGDIIRLYEKWGVIAVGELPPVVDWWMEDGTWHLQRWFDNDMTTFDHNYKGIPDEVLARATMIKLMENA